jgi:hypothetical protein
MTEEFPRPIHFVAGVLAANVVAVHVGLGVFNWARWLTAGFLLPRDFRWPVFVVSGIVMAVGVVAAGKGWTARRPLYVGGIVLSLGYVVGYFGWHLSGHRPLLIVGRGLPHDIDTVQFVLDHLFAGPLEFFAIFTEVTLAVVLAYLLVVERR